MAYFEPCTATSRSYFEALELAERRALHSYFDQHIVADEELGYVALDEGDYCALPALGGACRPYDPRVDAG